VLRILLIALGGGFGSVMRYWLGGWTQRLAGISFPAGTLVVNVLGCLLIGFLSALFLGRVVIRDDFRFAIMVGVLGGFTTFSSYSWETIALVNGGQAGLALLNVVATNVLGLAAAWLAYRLGVWAFGIV
jgi:CrcB protein